MCANCSWINSGLSSTSNTLAMVHLGGGRLDLETPADPLLRQPKTVANEAALLDTDPQSTTPHKGPSASGGRGPLILLVPDAGCITRWPSRLTSAPQRRGDRREA